MGVASGTRVTPRRGAMVGVAFGLLLLLLLPVPGQASRPIAPPTAAEVERRTEAFLDRHGARPGLRGGGGIGADPTEPGGEDGSLLGGKLAVALYGAPQLTATAVGKRPPGGAARKLRKQAAAYAQGSERPVIRSLNLIGVIATASAGSDGKYRARQPDEVIRRYLKAARSVEARLTLDIQPGRSPLMRELKALRRWIALPDVDVGIDPEWNVGREGVPGRTGGSIAAKQLNRATAWVERLVERRGVPAKAVIVHQFRKGSIRGRSRVEQRDGANVLLNFDGIGSRGAKKAGYENLAVRHLLDGFSLFYDRDTKLMRPRGVLRLRPEVDYAMYQ